MLTYLVITIGILLLILGVFISINIKRKENETKALKREIQRKNVELRVEQFITSVKRVREFVKDGDLTLIDMVAIDPSRQMALKQLDDLKGDGMEVVEDIRPFLATLDPERLNARHTKKLNH
jgi:hypothetical protein